MFFSCGIISSDHLLFHRPLTIEVTHCKYKSFVCCVALGHYNKEIKVENGAESAKIVTNVRENREHCVLP